MRVACLSGGVRRASSRAACRRARPGRADRRSATSATTSRCSACTSRPTSTRSSTPRGAERRGAGLGARGGDLAHARRGRRVGRGGMVHARRPRPRASPRPHRGVARRRAALGRDRPARGRRGPRDALLPATTILCGPSSSRRGGSFAFQEWFVARRHADEVDALALDGAEAARPAPGVVEAIDAADLLVSRRATRTSRSARSSPCPRSATRSRRRVARCVAVSPLIGGRAVKGPLDRMLTRMAGGTTPAHLRAGTRA